MFQGSDQQSESGKTCPRVDLVEIRYISSAKGRGLFATRDIPASTILEEAPVIPIPVEDEKALEPTVLNNYLFEWIDPAKPFKMVIIMTPFQFVNHSFKPNVKYVMDHEKDVIRFISLRAIMAGEELTVNYNGSVDCNDSVWFEVIEGPGTPC